MSMPVLDTEPLSLANGVRVHVIGAGASPLAEVRLVIGLPEADLTVVKVLAEVMRVRLLSDRPDGELPLEDLGLLVSVDVNADRLELAASCYEGVLPALIARLGAVLEDAGVDEAEVGKAVAQLRAMWDGRTAGHESLTIARLLGHVFGKHPYAHESGSVSRLKRFDPAELGECKRIALPEHTDLLIVTSSDAASVLQACRISLSRWATTNDTVFGLSPPAHYSAGRDFDTLPGAARTVIRLALPGVPFWHDDAAAVRVAGWALGGGLTSRLITELHIAQAAAHTPRVNWRLRRHAAVLVVSVDLVTDSADRDAHAILDLLDLTSRPLTPAEVEAAQRYGAGVAAMQTSSRAGIADLASSLSATGRTWSTYHRQLAETVSLKAVEANSVAQKYFRAERTSMVVLSPRVKN